jgi:membrane-associated phospholipid phosphatase
MQMLAWGCALAFIVTICFSRIYCGMHTFTDIMGGLMFGAVLQGIWVHYFPVFDFWMTTNDNGMMKKKKLAH